MKCASTVAWVFVKTCGLVFGYTVKVHRLGVKDLLSLTIVAVTFDSLNVVETPTLPFRQLGMCMTIVRVECPHGCCI